MRIIVIIPAYNESKKIGDVIRKIPRNIKKSNIVLVAVIDDGSDDDTAKIARDAGADYVFKHSTNLGVGRAFRTGIRQVLALSADIIVNLDADDQFDPNEIPRVVAPILNNHADVVLGSRFLNRTTHTMPFLKRVGNLIVSTLVSVLSGKLIRDTQCGFRALSRRAAEALQLSGRFTYTQEMILVLSFKQMRIVEVPISVKYYRHRKSRVVSSIWSYTFKVLGVILITTIRHFWKHLALILLSTFLIGFLAMNLNGLF